MTISDNAKQEMKQGKPLILVNSDSTNPIYRMQVQTSNELPAYDMGYNKIKFNEQAIKDGVQDLVGSFMWDESQSAHNRKINPEMRGRKVAKVINGGYCPEYGAYTDIEVFDPEFVNTLEQALDSKQKGLPFKEGPSTELNASDGHKYGDNNLEVTKFKYNGLVWTDRPRDSKLGVCSVINNSILDIKEDKTMTDKIELTKEEYDALVLAKNEKERLESELEEGKGLYEKGKGLYAKGKEAFDKLKTESETEINDLKGQLLPIWEKQESEKVAMVNSIMETIPEAEKEAKKAIYERMDIEQLGEIVNSLPGSGGSQRGIQNGGVGSGRTPNNEEDIISEEDYYKGLGMKVPGSE